MTPQLDPDAGALLEVMRAAGTAQPYTLPVAEAREQARATLASGPVVDLHDVEDVRLPSVNGTLGLRLYRPRAGTLPLALFLHGGGWTLNDLDTHDRLSRRIAQRSGCLLASLDFRRAPEHRHPAALGDALLAYRWLLDNAARIEADSSRVALVGESSGATTATCLAMLLRDLQAPQPCLQALAYPITDPRDDWPSFSAYGDGYVFDREFARWSQDNYVPAGHDAGDPYLYPLAAADLSGVAPAFVMTAEFDPLRDQGIAYAEKLEAAGVAVEHVHAEDQMHGFLLLDRAVPGAGALLDRFGDALSTRIQAHA